MSFHFHSFLVSIVAILYSSIISFALLDNIGPFQSISEGTSLVSKNGTFEFGFFRIGNSTNRYVGIWFKKIPVRTVVWVANRCNPINDSSGSLTINGSGDLVLLQQNKTVAVVSSTSPSKQARNPTLQLLDSGNLVLRDESGNYLWQSFDFPSDTLLLGMKFGWDLKRGLNRNLSAWKSWDDPCHGDLVFGFEIADDRNPEAYMRRGQETIYRAGPWNGVRFSGFSELRTNQLVNYMFVHDGNELYSSYDLKNGSIVSIIVLNGTIGKLQRLTWVEKQNGFRSYASAPRDDCDEYGHCGTNGNCVISENPVCQCLKGFRPKSEAKWGLRDWSDGCVRNTPRNCKEREGFRKVVGLKMPDTKNTWLSDNASLSECRDKCLRECSCTAYSNSDIRGEGKGCRIWLSDLIDIREISPSGQDLYVRVSAFEMDKEKAGRRVRTTIIVAGVGATIFSGLLFVYCFLWKRMRVKKNVAHQNSRSTKEEDFELPLFKLETLITATDNFSLSNKLGEGGFGPVYKGKLEDGQEIAVKRLSSSSRQGMNEFRNEVTLIAKLQHRNLVKVIGCCIHGDEKLLVYEYMLNKSLDLFIFRQEKLEWPTRFRIICGIARGLMYLHQDSRLRIIHRDLKVSNVLLDNDMNPKISDFGLARTFGGDQTEANTNRIVGTHGYMAPEYAFSGIFSTKSDVFSFGIIVLEMVSGKRSMSFHHENHGLTLIGHAWTLAKEGRAVELIEMRLTNSYKNILQEVLRCIHIGLLCVQQRPVDRPDMSSVVLMLSSDENVLPEPKPPGYFMETDSQEGYHSLTYNPELPTTNSMTVTLINGR